MSEERLNIQQAPYPHELQDIVDQMVYKPGWTFRLEDINRNDDRGDGDCTGLTFTVCPPPCLDPYHPERGETYNIEHFFPVPPITYNATTWRRWVFDRIVKVETHEAMEHFTIEGWRPFAPVHGPGNNQYVIRETGDHSDHRDKEHHRQQELILREKVGLYGLMHDPNSSERQFAAHTLYNCPPTGVIAGTFYMKAAWKYLNAPRTEDVDA